MFCRYSACIEVYPSWPTVGLRSHLGLCLTLRLLSFGHYYQLVVMRCTCPKDPRHLDYLYSLVPRD